MLLHFSFIFQPFFPDSNGSGSATAARDIYEVSALTLRVVQGFLFFFLFKESVIWCVCLHGVLTVSDLNADTSQSFLTNPHDLMRRIKVQCSKPGRRGSVSAFSHFLLKGPFLWIS